MYIHKHNWARFTFGGAQSLLGLYTQTYNRESGSHVTVCPFSATIVSSLCQYKLMTVLLHLTQHLSFGTFPLGSILHVFIVFMGRQEEKWIKYGFGFRGLASSLTCGISRVIALGIILTYVSTGGELSSALVFSMLAYVEVLKLAFFHYVPVAVERLVILLKSIERLEVGTY